ncbi:hypothetical protein DPEC_G00351110 [Dallia pectoralis]|uniref:Uncharacterized protein n=1 Tax=Dallia pectoralis TaxID=75939 RepID=A0ACC2F1Z0_DALPE|nr:hypothetical protein DPEC_G00351110 [Dallia pectoralis]
MTSAAQQLLRSQRDVLLQWTCVHPVPLLRWLRDAGAISHVHYSSLLECSSSNAVAQVLETVCTAEESSRRFLEVLKELFKSKIKFTVTPEVKEWETSEVSCRNHGKVLNHLISELTKTPSWNVPNDWRLSLKEEDTPPTPPLTLRYATLIFL